MGIVFVFGEVWSLFVSFLRQSFAQIEVLVTRLTRVSMVHKLV